MSEDEAPGRNDRTEVDETARRLALEADKASLADFPQPVLTDPWTAPRLSTDPPGYWLGDEFRAGFPDDPGLPIGARRRVAAWCRKYKPHDLTEAHRDALEAPFSGEISPAQREAERLGNKREPSP